ncbi:MAG: hypothetical protein H7199_10060 [Burkholderiales bacterium]|nr:hypothetical protein [Flavobacterium sp.]
MFLFTQKEISGKINIKDVTTQSGKIEINELLQHAAPSFYYADEQDESDAKTVTNLTQVL